MKKRKKNMKTETKIKKALQLLNELDSENALAVESEDLPETDNCLDIIEIYQTTFETRRNKLVIVVSRYCKDEEE